MRYEFVGRKSKFVGKTLWEIVGNLKNFGVGRLVKVGTYESDPTLSFFKIVKVQPLPPFNKEFVDRSVIAWIDVVSKDRKLGVMCTSRSNNYAKFQLIPKEDEPKYYERLEKLQPPVKVIQKYCEWPPLYKTLWEKEDPKGIKHGPIPKLLRLNPEEPGVTVIEKEEECKKSTCSLYKTDLTVDEMYKEIVRLKLLIKANTSA